MAVPPVPSVRRASSVPRACLRLALVLCWGGVMVTGAQRDLAAFQFVPSRQYGYLTASPSYRTTLVRPSAGPNVTDTVTRMAVSLEESLHVSETPATLTPALEGALDIGSLAASSSLAGGGVLKQGFEGLASRVTTKRQVKRAVEALPGTWMAAGLPKWVHTMRRRMITKEDYLHAHAASGVLYLVGGSLWLINVMGLEIFAGVPQLETATPIPLLLLGAGLANTLSAIPMANTRSWVLQGLGISLIQLWMAWYVSGAYPASLAVADPWLAAASLAIIVIGGVEAEEAIASDARAKKLVRASGGQWLRRGKVTMRRGDENEGAAINRFGSYANLIFNGPHLYAILVGGGWLDRLAAEYPDTPALLFHGYFALATGSSLALLAPTLYARKLIDAKTMLAMQFLTAAPLVSSLVDATVMGSTATNNPLDIYLGFLS